MVFAKIKEESFLYTDTTKIIRDLKSDIKYLY